MDVLVDLGNSALKWATLDNGTMHYGGAVLHEKLPDELDGIWQGLSPRHVFLASVASDHVTQGVRQWTRRHWGIACEALRSTPQALGVRNGYTHPERLGVDRWLALLGAWQRWPQEDLAVIDYGTAIKVDVLDSSGQHHGGWIAPGLGLLFQALARGTQVTVPGEAMPPSGVCAVNTGEAVTQGCEYMVQGYLNHCMVVLRQHWGDTIRCIVTGGDALGVGAANHPNCIHQPHLVLEGMAALVGARVLV